MAFTPVENLDLRRYGILADGGTSITAWYPVGQRDIADIPSLKPGNTLPQETTFDDSGGGSAADAGIVAGEYRDNAGIRHAVITAHLPAYFQAVQDRTGTVSGGAFAGGETTVTATSPIFYPSLVGESVVIDNSVGTFVVASYTSPTVIVVTGDASAAAADTITFDEGSRLLTEATTDDFGWSRDGWWLVVRRWLCETEDREAEMIYLKTQTFTFEGELNNVVGYPFGASSRGRAPSYPHKALIMMNFEAPIYDV